MTEEEKMLGGLPYSDCDENLTKKRLRARKLLYKLDKVPDWNFGKREKLFRELLGACGKNVRIERGFKCDYGSNIYLGDNFFANFNCTILDCGKVVIGDNCFIGPSVSICTPMHPFDAETRNSGVESAIGVSIGNNVWICTGAIINPGVKIGDNVVIGSGSVVTSDIESNCVVVGVPAKVIKKL